MTVKTGQPMERKAIPVLMHAGVKRAGPRLVVVAVLLLMAAPVAWAATPLSGQATQERLDRRKGDRQLQNRLDAPRLHEVMRDDQREAQARRARPGRRAREWDDNLVPRPQQFDDRLDKQRRVRATF